VDATFETSRTPPTTFDDNSTTSWSPVEIGPVEVVSGRDGRTFVAETAAEQLTEALRAGDRAVDLEVEVTPPALTNAEAEEQRPTHLLSTFTTYYTAGQTRVANIQRLADVVDGAQVLPGDDFSINRISGERSCSKGYQPAGTIVRGELVDTCGGGVSQFGTTTFNAAFFSGLQLDQWQAHSFYISRYPRVARRRCRTPSSTWCSPTPPTPRGGPGLYTSTSITVSLYGRPIASRVTASHGQPYDRVPDDRDPHHLGAACRTDPDRAVTGQRRVQGPGRAPGGAARWRHRRADHHDHLPAAERHRGARDRLRTRPRRSGHRPDGAPAGSTPGDVPTRPGRRGRPRRGSAAPAAS
jgi:hypothetical protein